MEYEITDQPQEGYRPERTAIDGVSPERKGDVREEEPQLS